MGPTLKRLAFVIAASVMMLVPGAAANASGDGVACAANGGWCDSGMIAANPQYHCLKYQVTRAWWGSTSWGIMDNDTTQTVAGGTIPWYGFDPSGTVYGLYGQHYYAYMYNSGTGAWITVTNDCTY